MLALCRPWPRPNSLSNSAWDNLSFCLAENCRVKTLPLECKAVAVRGFVLALANHAHHSCYLRGRQQACDGKGSLRPSPPRILVGEKLHGIILHFPTRLQWQCHGTLSDRDKGHTGHEREGHAREAQAAPSVSCRGALFHLQCSLESAMTTALPLAPLQKCRVANNVQTGVADVSWRLPNGDPRSQEGLPQLGFEPR